MVTKTVTSNTQNSNGTWTIIYDVAVTNPNASIETSFALTDTLAFGNNIDVNLAKVTGTGASAAWNGNDRHDHRGRRAARPRSDRAVHRDSERRGARRRHRQ